MNVARKVRDFAQAVNMHAMSYVDLNECMGELRVVLARLSIEKENRLNERAKEDAQIIHDEQEDEREKFEAAVRQVVEGKKTHK
ncbi:MAG: hypothetical protein GY905_09210 [Gammaproteobacteria bacterium]|nr:hypothetical protein [Gammaproteobacteria bacterium]